MCSINTVQWRPFECQWWQPFGKKSQLETKLSGIFQLPYWDMGRQLDVDMESFIYLYIQRHKQRCHSSGCRLAQMQSTVLVPLGACFLDEIWECDPGQIGTLCQIPIHVRTFKLKTLRFFNWTMTYWSLNRNWEVVSAYRELRDSNTSVQPILGSLNTFLFFLVLCYSPALCNVYKVAIQESYRSLSICASLPHKEENITLHPLQTRHEILSFGVGAPCLPCHSDCQTSDSDFTAACVTRYRVLSSLTCAPMWQL